MSGRVLAWESKHLIGGAVIAGAICGVGLVVAIGPLAANALRGDDLVTLKSQFRRPATVPFPAFNPFSENKRALGERLFYDTRLSVNGRLSCASCHDRAKGFTDGRAHGSGVSGRPLARHVPSLWNLAWAGALFWDGRARSLEDQSAFPIQNPDEMAQPFPQLIAKLQVDPDYVSAFARAFPDEPEINSGNLSKAIATFERTLVSPRTRFDRWVEGQNDALTANEIEGFRLFTGKAGCSTCHSGFAFTDYSFQDIGLPGDDRGRGQILRIKAAEHAFKVSSLRELGRSAPYMHDGSLATLDDVIRHYQGGVIHRPTLSKDLPAALSLSDRERSDLIAFIRTLTAKRDPQPLTPIVPAIAGPGAPAERIGTVSQDNKTFIPGHIELEKGERLWIVNNDSRTHNVRVFDPKFKFDAGAQEPGETVQVAFPSAGSFLVFCGIHPKMELYADVEP